MRPLPLSILEAYQGDENKAYQDIAQQRSIWTCGRDLTQDGQKHMTMKDALGLPNASLLIPHVLTQFVLEGIEPNLVGAKLLTEIPYVPGLRIQFPAIGALYAEDVAAHQSLPEITPDMGGQISNEMGVGKSGLALKIFDEIIKYDQYNLVAYWLRLAGNALARHKEQKIFNFITSMGAVAFDNANRSGSILGKYTSGRNADGTLNGSMTMDDVFEMYTLGMTSGYHLDTILVHPLTWLMWLRDPVFRTYQLQFGGGQWFNPWTGNAMPDYSPLRPFGGMGEGRGQRVVPPGTANSTKLPEYDQTLSSVPNLPRYLGLNFQIIPSPSVPFNVTNNTATMIFFNSQNLGALIVEERPKVQEFKNPEHEITKLQIAEKYGLAVLNEGQAVFVAKNVKVARNFITDESVKLIGNQTVSLADPATASLTL